MTESCIPKPGTKQVAGSVEYEDMWCGKKRVQICGEMLLDEGDPLPGVECEECRKAKAAADVEEPPKA